MTKWDDEHKHPCIDCGIPCDCEALRCQSCAAKERWTRPGMREKWEKYRGINSPFWKGNRYKDTKGYIRIYMRGHPRANSKGRILEHIYLWEQAHSKPLPDGWLIHHLNGIKDDNRICNLEALPNKKHYLVLQAKAKRIQELEALLNSQHQLL